MNNNEKQAMTDTLDTRVADGETFDIPVGAYVVYADNYGFDLSDFDDWMDAANEAYEGDFDSDEDFAQNLADAIGATDEVVSWPYTCIDWEHAAHELMFDYFSEDNYYFRSM